MADQHNSNIPAMGNQISADIPDIKENLEYHVDVLQNFINLWNASTATGIFPVKMADADVDTLIQLEESANENIIRFDCGGTEIATIDGTNKLKVDTINELTAANGITIDSLAIKDGKLVTANSVVGANITDGIIDNVHLNTTTQTDSHTGDTAVQEVTLTGGSYCFFPQTKTGNAAQKMSLTLNYTDKYTGTTYIAYAAYAITSATAYTAYLLSRYVTASGPVYWVFGLLDKETNLVTRWNACMDHPSYGNGGDPAIIQHPFFQYDKDKFQIIVSNPPEEQLKDFKKIALNDGLYLSELIATKCKFNFSRSEQWTKELVTVATSPDPRDVPIGSEVKRIRKPVPVLKDAIVLPLELK